MVHELGSIQLGSREMLWQFLSFFLGGEGWEGGNGKQARSSDPEIKT